MTAIPVAKEMAASFNRGYRGFQQSYRSVSRSPPKVFRRYLEKE